MTPASVNSRQNLRCNVLLLFQEFDWIDAPVHTHFFTLHGIHNRILKAYLQQRTSVVVISSKTGLQPKSC